MKTVLKVLAVFAIVLLMSGCSQKVLIKALNPAEVGEMATKKKVAVSDFKNDSRGLSGKIEAQLSKYKLDKKKYFTVLSRTNLNKIMTEHNLQSSEVMDQATSTKIGKIIGAQAIISGEIASATAETGSYAENRKKCAAYYKDGGCARYRHYQVLCKTIQAEVSANITVVDVETGSIIYGDMINKEYNANSCRQERVISKGQAINKLTTSIAYDFVRKLTPQYTYFKVELFKGIELKNTTEKQNKDFDNSLLYIKANRMNKAADVLQKLFDELNGKSYVVAYTLGVVNEALGQYEKAKDMYSIADNLTIEPNKLINQANTRIEIRIEKNKEALKQMSTK